MTKKDIFFWALYDFANSIAYVGFIFYFGLWLVSDMGASDTWLSGAVALSTVLLLFTLPVLGHLSDRIRKRMPFLDRKSTRLNSSHSQQSRMPSSA